MGNFLKDVVASAVTLMVLTNTSHAQRLRGTVVDASTGFPIPAALLTSRDSLRNVKTRHLTTTAGTFDLEVAAQPRSVTVEFVGYRPTTLALTSEPVQNFRVELQPLPLTLTSVVAEAKNRCGKTEDPNIVAVWYSARAALGSSRVTSARRFRTREFMRELDRKLQPVGYDSMDFNVTRGSDAYRAVSSDSLDVFGYVKIENGRRYYYGPDAELLLSDAFVNNHCFGITRKGAPRGMVGLEFWPMAEREVKDIRGVMWLTESNAELDRVEYNYTGLDQESRNNKYTLSTVDFERLTDGSWVVREWRIRVPRKADFQFGATGRPRTLDVGASEGGGEFLGFARESAAPDEIGVVLGTVYDSIAGGPLVGAPVYLAGTPHETTTDSAGTFRFDSATVGVHYVAFYDPMVAARPLAERVARLEVRRGGIATARLGVPREDILIERLCPSSRMKDQSKLLGWKKDALGVVTGRVTSRGGSVRYVMVELEWDLNTPGRPPIDRKIKSFTTETGKTGEYIICGLPSGFDVTVRVKLGESTIASEFVRNAPRVLAKDFDVVID